MRLTLKWALWALFGNDEDGSYGGGPETVKQAVWWWLRNPFHNFMFHVIALPLWWSIPLIGRPEKSPSFWPRSNGIMFSLNVLPLFAWRIAGWEGYVGFRPWARPTGEKIAVFGLAFRKV